MKYNTRFKTFSTTLVWIWLGIFVLIPSFLLLATSLLVQGDSELVRLQPTFQNYFRLLDLNYLRVFVRSGLLAGTCTLGCLILAYPFSYLVARMPERYKGFLLLLVIIPFWTSSLIRSYAIVMILKTHGILNSFLMWLGIIKVPMQFLYTQSATLIGLIYTLLPLMILPLYASIEKLDFRLIDAARDLGARKYQIFFKVLLPLTLPGILAGCILVLLPAMTLFYIPDLLGGAKTVLIGNIIQNQFLGARDWPMGATISVALTGLMSIALFVYWRYYHQHRHEYAYEQN
jgi:spermidine/putrescine transport system permease protein